MSMGMKALGFIGMGLLLATAVSAVPSGLLNDTGQIRCLNVTGTALEDCTQENSGDDSPFPGQDGRYGRDAAAKYPEQSGFNKPEGSGGQGSFAFTPLDVNGNPIPLVGDPPVPAETPRCVWDRVTNLIWEVKTDDGGLQDKDWTYAWGTNIAGTCYGGQSPAGCSTNNFITALNAASICPMAGAGVWRLPTRRELLSILNPNRSYPAIDTAFFPNTQAVSDSWSADKYVYVPVPARAWIVSFAGGKINAFTQTSANPVRLVRSGP